MGFRMREAPRAKFQPSTQWPRGLRAKLVVYMTISAAMSNLRCKLKFTVCQENMMVGGRNPFRTWDRRSMKEWEKPTGLPTAGFRPSGTELDPYKTSRVRVFFRTSGTISTRGCRRMGGSCDSWLGRFVGCEDVRQSDGVTICFETGVKHDPDSDIGTLLLGISVAFLYGHVSMGQN